jgi:hypothetical protein
MAVDYTSGASGALGGASTGFALGGPIGGVAGGLLGGVAGLFGGGRKKRKKLSTMDKRQQQLNEQQYQGLTGQGPLADMYNYNPEAANDVFNKTYADPAYKKFQEELAPSVTGQFRNQGLMSSSYAGDALSRLARDVQQGLDAQRAQYLYGQEQNAKGAKQQGLQNFQNQQTFAYDKSAPNSGFDINKVLESVTPEMRDQLTSYMSSFKTNRG